MFHHFFLNFLGWGDFGPAVFVTTGDNPGGISNYRGVNPDDPIYVGEAEESGDKVQATVGIIISILVVLGIVGALAFFIRRNNSAWSKQNVASLGKDCDSLDYRGLDSHFNHDNMPIVPTHIAGQGAPPIYNPFSSHKTYVDPHTYEVTFFSYWLYYTYLYFRLCKLTFRYWNTFMKIYQLFPFVLYLI